MEKIFLDFLEGLAYYVREERINNYSSLIFLQMTVKYL